MRLLLDSCIWGPTSAALRAAGHDVEWVGDWPADPGDEAILAHAYHENRILVTVDKDFGDLVVRLGFRHRGILRLTLTPVDREAEVCLAVLEATAEDLEAGAMVTASPRRTRIRRAYQPESD